MFWLLKSFNRLSKSNKSLSCQHLNKSFENSQMNKSGKQDRALNNDFTYRWFLCLYCLLFVTYLHFCQIPLATTLITCSPSWTSMEREELTSRYRMYRIPMKSEDTLLVYFFDTTGRPLSELRCSITESNKTHHCPGLSGNLVNHGERLSQGEDAVGGQTLWHRRRWIHWGRGTRGRDIFCELFFGQFFCKLFIP